MRTSTVVVVNRTGVVDCMMGHWGSMDEGCWNLIAMSLVMSSSSETVMCMKLLIGCLGKRTGSIGGSIAIRGYWGVGCCSRGIGGGGGGGGGKGEGGE